MEPRVPNLILSENHDPTRNAHWEHNNSASYPATTGHQLPAIRLRPVAAASQTNGSPFQDRTNQSWHSSSIVVPYLPAGTSKREANGLAKEQDELPQLGQRSAKSAVPLEQVLNNNSPESRTDYHFLSYDEERRKKRRVESDPRHLPKPSPSQKDPNKRRHARPLLPPLLAPLHNPPNETRIVPSIDTNDFRSRQVELPQPEPKPPPAIPTASTSLKAPVEEADHGFPLDPALDTQKIPQSQINQPNIPEPKKRKKNNRWTDEETKDLFKGITKFGIGSWKKILNHEEYHFNGRSAVDLKDRFRTVCPEEYHGSNRYKERSERKQSADSEKGNEQDQSELEQLIKGHRGADRLAQLGIKGPFPKRYRRGRREFTEEEDENLWKGFEKYGAKWKLIRDDPELHLDSRSRTDLRDRFRNRYPKRFVEAGYKYRLKESDETKDDRPQGSADSNKDNRDTLDPRLTTAPATAEDSDANLLFGVAPATSTFDPPLSATTRDRPSFPLRVLTETTSHPWVDFETLSDYAYSPLDDEDPATITLSRNIFDWADAQTSRTPLRAGADAQQAYQALSVAQGVHASQPKTLSALDQFRINPFVAMKGPSTSSLAHLMNSEDAVGGTSSASVGTAATVSANAGEHTSSGVGNNKEHALRASHLPLAGILNGPASLPPMSELMRDLDGEGKS